MGSILNTYAAYSKNEEIRLQSSSGGIFSILSYYIFSRAGVVYGVAMSEDCYYAEFVRVVDEKGLERLRGSKYLQAKVGDIFKSVKSDLDNGKEVLFTGTGCQVNGLKNFLGEEYKNLYCVDIVCHGTPSPKLWKKYVIYQEKQFNSKMRRVSFRSKDRNGWDGFEMKEINENGVEVYISRHIDLYLQLFVKNLCLRPSCYECIARTNKLSDLTIADFWGIENVIPEMNDNKGISLVIERTDKGTRLFETIKDNLEYREVSYEDGIKGNVAEYKSYDKPSQRDKFFIEMDKLSFEKLNKKYLKIPIKSRFKNAIKTVLLELYIGKKSRGMKERTLLIMACYLHYRNRYI